MPDSSDLQQIAERDRQIAELQEALQDQVGTLKRLIELTTMLNSSLNVSELLQMITSAAAELLHAETGSILLVDQGTGELTFEVATGEPGEEVMRHRVPAGQGVAGWVVQNAQVLVVEDPSKDPRFYGQIDRSVGFETRNILAIPLRVKDEIIGVAEVINKIGGAGFSRADIELGEALASQASVAINNARLYAQLADAVVTSRLSARMYQLGVE